MIDVEEVRYLLDNALRELRDEGLEPNILLVGPKFLKFTAEILKDCRLKIYKIDELGYDAVVADSQYLGQMKRASRRISVEPLLEESEMWKEIKHLGV